ncbi:hypothetical protein ABZ714_08875 [Streptomyces sp. NPDC006798]|uniref:hypothetical protein n=1 Tax=Streptomyces sp. NPDC006798 TaxID=3155462 RepID=UPI0033D11492
MSVPFRQPYETDQQRRDGHPPGPPRPARTNGRTMVPTTSGTAADPTTDRTTGTVLGTTGQAGRDTGVRGSTGARSTPGPHEDR